MTEKPIKSGRLGSTTAYVICVAFFVIFGGNAFFEHQWVSSLFSIGIALWLAYQTVDALFHIDELKNPPARHIVAPTMKPLPVKTVKVQDKKERTVAGFVYLLETSTGYWKIGRTKNPADRLRTFNVKLPFEVEYRVVIQTDDMYALESELHAKYAGQRVNGSEFFSLTEEQVAEIVTLANRETI